jgi:hypothetical protein
MDDVHTDENTETVLEEGGVHVDILIVAYKIPDGRIPYWSWACDEPV